MGIFSREKSPNFLFKTAPPPDLKKYIGMKVTIPPYGVVAGSSVPVTVVIDDIRGNIANVKFYQINYKYLIGMLRFHAQMERDKSITEEQFLEFEKMEVWIDDEQKQDSKKTIRDVKSEQETQQGTQRKH